MDEHLLVVKAAWNGYFGDIPPLTADRGYKAWEKRILGLEPKEGHKVCRACWKPFPYDAKFCHYCGEPLPDQLFFGDPEFSIARLQLADKRKCDVTDSPPEDVQISETH